LDTESAANDELFSDIEKLLNNDGNLQINKMYLPENRDNPDRIIIGSDWMHDHPPAATYDLPPSKKPPDPDLQSCLKSKLRACRLARLNQKEQARADVQFDGMDWISLDDGKWNVPSAFEEEKIVQHRVESYEDTFSHNDLKVLKCDTPTGQPPTNPLSTIAQCDPGANANVTNNLDLLSNVQWITPLQCESAKKDAAMTVVAIGEYQCVVKDVSIKINMYYSPESHGTIISPNAIIRQYRSYYIGWQQSVNRDRRLGDLRLKAREGFEDMIFPLYWENDLWFHSHMDIDDSPTDYPTLSDASNPSPSDDASDPSLHVNRLSDAAKFELWHQRLGHTGTRKLEEAHKCVTGVPKLRGNAFYKCPSCMSNKMTKNPNRGQLGSTSTSSPSTNNSSDDNDISDDPDEDNEDEWEEFLDELHIPNAQPGMHFHADFGFVRGSAFRMKTEDGKTITSIDGKNSYCLIVDRATRYVWVFIADSKEPPVEAIRMILQKFGAKIPHRTFRTDRDKGLNLSLLFRQMLVDEQFTPELTGTDSSAQNSRAERPHRDLGQMMRCMLHSAGLGPEYWSYALLSAVYIKNRLPHSALKMTPYQAFTGQRPDLSRARIFGSRVYARKTGNKKAKLDNHTSEGVFLAFTPTAKNVYYIDDATGTVKVGQHVLFDEAHMTVPAGRAPLAAQALQRLGYYVRETWIDHAVQSEYNADVHNVMQVELLTKTAITPSRATANSIGYDVHLDLEDIVLPPGETRILPTGFAAKAPAGTYLRIAPRSGLTVKRNLNTVAGVVDPDYTGCIMVVMRNMGSEPQQFCRGDKIAQIIVEKASMPTIELVTCLPKTTRGDSGFGSTSSVAPLTMDDFVIQPHADSDPEPVKKRGPPDKMDSTFTSAISDRIQSQIRSQPSAAAAASFIVDTDEIIFPDDIVQVETFTDLSSHSPLSNLRISAVDQVTHDIHLAFDMPYDICLTSSPFDNQTHRKFATFGTDPLLGMDLEMCDKFGLPKMTKCKLSTPCARIQKWRSELKGAYVTSVNDIPVSSIDEIKSEIQKLRLSSAEQAKIGFATIEKHSMHPQLGIPQVYQDQMNVIGKHLWDIQNDPEWNSSVEEALPLLEAVRQKQIKFSPDDEQQLKDLLRINSVKKQRKMTRRILQKQDDWPDWENSEFKQLDQYEDQSTFGEPQSKPPGANLLSLIWVYLIKDDGRKKARCVCNGAKNMRGSVTLAETYASSLDQNGSRVFWAATAINNFIVIGADAANAFAEAPAPVAPLYVYADEQYKAWYHKTYPDRPPIPTGSVMRVKKALQGHPESPRLWAQLIDKIILNLNLKPCKHEPNLYYTDNYMNTGKRVLFLRQVDDFAVSCQDRSTAQDVISQINSKMTIEVKELGTIERFNGIDVDQTRDYIKLSNGTYIRKILRNHQWILDDEYPPSLFPLPMKSDTVYARRIEEATPLTESERLLLESKLGFTYRQAIGELIYALVTCRPDISYACIKLSQYSAAPAELHFDAVKDIFRYLKATQDDGIYYWRTEPRMDLPKKAIPSCKSDENYDESSIAERQQECACRLSGAVDSDHAGDVTHRKSVTGIVLKLAGGVVLYKTAFQATIAHSSTESEFTAAADAAKYILYLRTLLHEIGLSQEDATILYEDNQGALLMANAQKPTKRTRHMDIKVFALQDWVKRDLLNLQRINTSDNYSDAMTKSLGRTLFYRHMNFIMGRIVPAYAYKPLDLTFRRFYDINSYSLEFNKFISWEGIKPRSLVRTVMASGMAYGS
jgi:deoxyuridine 5'-triphosphate nucleotidohydrolase